ncbi:MAG: hypothetical protein GOP50_11570 [Candidatus Heimdallarchaeota archaeon]|nr:hypothetical protein [Candidatus Heimdallarchaeota archaeon]
MNQRKKPWLEKEVDEIKQDEEKENTTKTIKVNWMRILLLGFLSSMVFIFINFIIFLIFYFGFDSETLFILYFMQYVFFGEAGLVIFIGACLGNFGQSVFISNIKERFMGSDPLTGDSFREATFNSFTYYLGGMFILFYGLILFGILRLISLLP